MKNITKEELEQGRPTIDVLEGLNFCLDQLYEDREHTFYQDIVKGLTFEELIGVLLLARDEVKRYEEFRTEQDDAE